MARKKVIQNKCENCPQYSDGTCLVLSVNVKKYGKPKECTL